MFNVCMCARYQSDPKESHLKALKSAFLDTFMVHLSMGFGFPKVVIIVWLVTLILILPVINRIGKVLVKLVTYFQTP